VNLIKKNRRNLKFFLPSHYSLSVLLLFSLPYSLLASLPNVSKQSILFHTKAVIYHKVQINGIIMSQRPLNISILSWIDAAKLIKLLVIQSFQLRVDGWDTWKFW